ncbi:tetratricopeptide repeat protein [Kitasatospora sp. NBC_01250]|uniref:tetratricopeptide repeat protein n=1 Tax=Kitasatospora sp. NBC_01250 TaxID=2903571 RepID=UPI002E3561C4|nr:tetratricopeptide repeat protein [Kitasatospora sp. NBC_01250]
MSATRPAAPDADRHLALVGARRRDREACRAALALPPLLLPVIAAHRRLRGPYTVAGTLLRAVVPDALERHPELVAAHEVELLTVAPELRDLVPATRETLTSLAVPEERTRFYSRWRTLRIAHGLMEFLRDLLAVDGFGPRTLVVDDLDRADPTDQEFMAVLLRRMDPAVLTVVVQSTARLLEPVPRDPWVEPGTPAGEDLPALLRGCRRVEAVPTEPASSEAVPGGPASSEAVPDEAVPDEAAADAAALRARAARYVTGDATDDDPGALDAYQRLPLDERRRLHDQRADELVAAAEPSLALGAIPYHREHGSDPVGTGAPALAHAMDTCMLLGFYDATIDFCERGRALVDWEQRPDLWWQFTSKMPTSLSALGRAEEAEAICDEARAQTTKPVIHIQCAYATSMLYTRHREPTRRDHQRALAWINEAIAMASLLPDPRLRAFNTVFHHNGLALIEGHRGRPHAALELVTAGLAELDRELGPDEHHLHRSVLRHNRAQVLTGLGRLDEALEEYRAVLAVDPSYPEYHFDLGNLLRRMGREQEALEAYERALRLGPPFPEVFYNRGDVRNAAGDVEGALADFGYVLELDPGFVDAYVNRAGIRLDLEDVDGAERDALAGLKREPGNAYLRAVLGHVHAAREEHTAAREAFDRALAADPDLVAALCGRAAVAHQLGDADTALADLRHAVELAPDDPGVRYNHAFALRSAGRWDAALAELDIAAELLPDDPDVLAAREECRAEAAAGR